MGKRLYVKPVCFLETFTPNEYITACWGVACKFGEAGGEWGEDNNQAGHDIVPQGEDGTLNRHRKTTKGSSAGAGCGWFTNQVITGEPNNWSMKEINSPVQPDPLPCEVTYYEDNNNDGWPDNGSTIKWTNTKNGLVWHHEGTVVYDAAHKSNHS